MLSESTKKKLYLVEKIVTWVFVVLAIFMMIFTVSSVSLVNREDRSLFGIQMYIVKSDSMSKTDFKAGDLIFSKSVDPKTLKDGDIITFISQNPESKNEIVTHKIRQVVKEGKLFMTYGTTTDKNDEVLVQDPYILGKYTGKVSGLGYVFSFLKSPAGYITCILIPFLLLIGYHGARCVVLFKRYRGEQMSKLEDERKKLEEERKASEATLRELQALKAQLEAQNAAKEAPPADSEQNNG